MKTPLRLFIRGCPASSAQTKIFQRFPLDNQASPVYNNTVT